MLLIAWSLIYFLSNNFVFLILTSASALLNLLDTPSCPYMTAGLCSSALITADASFQNQSNSGEKISHVRILVAAVITRNKLRQGRPKQ